MRKGASERLITLAAVLSVAAVLLATSRPRVIGDGAEYVAAARKFADLQWPSFSTDEAAALDPRVKLVGTRAGRLETVHFWVYPLLAAPLVRPMAGWGFSVEWAFTVLNLGLFALALALAVRRASPWSIVLIFLSPILWWLNKPHPEVFTFSLLTVAMLTAADRPGVAMVCCGLAATQNPPAAALIPLILLLYPAARSSRVSTAVAVLLAALHPLYYAWAIGRPTALIEGDIRVPPLMRYGTVVWDLNLGLLPNAPLFALTVTFAALAAWRGWASRGRDMMFALLAALWLLFSFTQAININHGGTPSMSRYALWLVPLAVPLLPSVSDGLGKGTTMLFGTLAVASALWSAVAFHPQRAEGHLRPTRLASWQWTNHPSWQNPVPEVFAERLRGRDAVNELAATPGCEKVLIQAGTWPYPCPAQPLPERCAAPDTWCYGNRIGGGYEFVPVPRRGGYRLGWPIQKGR